jgi:rare lipoprotein A
MMKKTLILLSCLLISNTIVAETGIASFYSRAHHGKTMANGKKFNEFGLTAASRTLPLGSRVKVTSMKSKKSVIVTITDRGPRLKMRLIDLSYTAAQDIGMIAQGRCLVTVEPL